MKEYNMTEQQEYYTFTKDVKTLIQYVQEQAFDHLVVEAANRLNWAIKKDLKGYGIPVTPAKESKYSFEEEKKQYAEDSRTHKKPWELWEWQVMGCTTWSALLGDDPMWLQNRRYRRKQIVKHPTINIGGVELPMPETEEPEKGTKYWLNPDCIDMYWCGYYHDRAFLKAGRVHLTKDNAKAWADWWKKEVLAKIDEIDN